MVAWPIRKQPATSLFGSSLAQDTNSRRPLDGCRGLQKWCFAREKMRSTGQKWRKTVEKATARA
jgi:hypothetical protein